MYGLNSRRSIQLDVYGLNTDNILCRQIQIHIGFQFNFGVKIILKK